MVKGKNGIKKIPTRAHVIRTNLNAPTRKYTAENYHSTKQFSHNIFFLRSTNKHSKKEIWNKQPKNRNYIVYVLWNNIADI